MRVIGCHSGEWARKPTNWEPLQEAPFFLLKSMKISIVLTFLLFLSCSKNPNERIITEEEILKRLSAIDEGVRLMPDRPDVVGCKNYYGCKKFVRALFFNIEIFLVEMQSVRIAKEYAEKKNVERIQNWLIDNIERENGIKKKIKEASALDLSTIKPKEDKKENKSSH